MVHQAAGRTIFPGGEPQIYPDFYQVLVQICLLQLLLRGDPTTQLTCGLVAVLFLHLCFQLMIHHHGLPRNLWAVRAVEACV